MPAEILPGMQQARDERTNEEVHQQHNGRLLGIGYAFLHSWGILEKRASASLTSYAQRLAFGIPRWATQEGACESTNAHPCPLRTSHRGD